MKGKLTVEQVAVKVGVSVNTVNNWYRWKMFEPEHEMAKLLPDFEQSGERQTRYWKKEDIKSLKEFQKKLPKGRNGILGKATQRYCK